MMGSWRIFKMLHVILMWSIGRDTLTWKMHAELTIRVKIFP